MIEYNMCGDHSRDAQCQLYLVKPAVPFYQMLGPYAPHQGSSHVNLEENMIIPKELSLKYELIDTKSGLPWTLSDKVWLSGHSYLTFQRELSMEYNVTARITVYDGPVYINLTFDFTYMILVCGNEQMRRLHLANSEYAFPLGRDQPNFVEKATSANSLHFTYMTKFFEIEATKNEPSLGRCPIKYQILEECQ
jgi:hypothetical protein